MGTFRIMGVFASVLVTGMMAVSPASARLPEAFSNLPKEIVRQAVHMPTGCLAQITVNDRKVVHARIVDPECLPKGVKARPVPGEARDFSIIDGVH